MLFLERGGFEGLRDSFLEEEKERELRNGLREKK